MIGHQPIIEMRMARKKPASVFVWCGKSKTAKDWHRWIGSMPEVEIPEGENIETLDLRWAVGLTVMISGEESRVQKAFEQFMKAKAGWVIASVGKRTIDSKGVFHAFN